MVASPSAADRVALEPLLPNPPPSGTFRGGALPAALRAAYGGDLAIPLVHGRPTLIANFVSTLDGVVSYNSPEAAGGGEISGPFGPDRFVMGLLRAVADVVLIGAGNLRAAPREAWTPRFIHPESAAGFAALRRRLRLQPDPITMMLDPASRQITLDDGSGLPYDALLIAMPTLSARQPSPPRRSPSSAAAGSAAKWRPPCASSVTR